MEAWTSWPGALADAVKSGRAREMKPGDVLETTLHAVVFGDVDAVAELRADGSVVEARENDY
jgi:hypothetical protein